MNEDFSIVLEPLHSGHAPALWSCIGRNRLYLQQWIDWVGRCQTEAQLLHYIRTAEDQADRQEGLTMVLLLEGQLVGIISLQHWDHALQLAELGFWIDASCQGKGLMQQAIRQMLAFGFRELKLQKVAAACAATNTRVLRMLQYMGFAIEGVLRRATWGRGLLCDKVMLGLLKEAYL